MSEKFNGLGVTVNKPLARGDVSILRNGELVDLFDTMVETERALREARDVLRYFQEMGVDGTHAVLGRIDNVLGLGIPTKGGI